MLTRRGRLRFFYGPMGAGKSTLALQTVDNLRRAGHSGALFTGPTRDAAGAAITSRLGVAADAIPVEPDTCMPDHLTRDDRFVVADEAQFLTGPQVEDLAKVADWRGVDVYAYGLLTDFRSRMFPGSARLMELACERVPLQVDVFCWCGSTGQVNARIIDGAVAYDGPQVLVGDVDGAYTVLCRHHWLTGQHVHPERPLPGVPASGWSGPLAYVT